MVPCTRRIVTVTVVDVGLGVVGELVLQMVPLFSKSEVSIGKCMAGNASTAMVCRSPSVLQGQLVSGRFFDNWSEIGVIWIGVIPFSVSMSNGEALFHVWSQARTVKAATMRRSNLDCWVDAIVSSSIVFGWEKVIVA